jgi:cation diffusion facilitator family transporter
MHGRSLERFQHDHTFGQEIVRAGERRTLLVIALTGTMMVVEIVAGGVFGSMALLADGLHMGSHVVALGITVLAYRYARRHAADDRFTFGTGKVNALGGFAGAVLLAVFAGTMAWESLGRFLGPVPIAFDQAIAVAVAGLVVNGASVLILEGDHHGDDHNLRSAYLHVLTDAVTSVLAIVALLAGKLLGLLWMDPLMGIVGAVLICRWSWGLLRQTSAALLDHRAPEAVCSAIRDAIEKTHGDRVTDLHVWAIGPGCYAAIIGVATHTPEPVEAYKARLPRALNLAHTTIEVHRCD